MKLKGFDRNGQQISRVLFDYARSTGIHNGLMLFREGNPHPVASITAILGDKEATLTEWDPRECVDESKKTKLHHWLITPGES